MAGLVPAIHVCLPGWTIKTWMPGTRPGMTKRERRDRQQKGPGKTGALEIDESESRSARIEFDDQMRLHLHRERHVREARHALKLRGHLGVIGLDIVGHVALGKLRGFQHMRELL